MTNWLDGCHDPVPADSSVWSRLCSNYPWYATMDTRVETEHAGFTRTDWDGPNYGSKRTASICIKGNMGPHQSSPNGDNWCMLMASDR